MENLKQQKKQKKLLLEFKQACIEFPVESQYRQALSGWKIRRLEENLSVGIYVSNEIVKVEGVDEQSVEMAVKELKKLIEEQVERTKQFGANVTEVIQVKPEQVGKVIGKKGINVTRIKNLTDAKIDVSKERTSITITGLPDAVALAKNEILELLQEPTPPEHVEEIHVPGKYFGRLAGPRGTKLKQLEKEHSVQIKLEKNESIKIAGSEIDCMECAQTIEDLIENFKQRDEERDADRPQRFVEPPVRKDSPRPQQSITNDPFFTFSSSSSTSSSSNVDPSNSWSKKLFG